MKFKIFLIITLLLLPLGSVSANMAAPFGFGSAMGNLITNPQDVLEVEEENITFELSGRSVSAHIIYEIVNTGEDADFTFIFPALNPVMEKDQYAFKVKVSQKEVAYKAKDLYEMRNLVNGGYEGIEGLINFGDLVYFDPLTGEEYIPNYRVGNIENMFFVFDVLLKNGVSTEIEVDFNSLSGFDSRRHQRWIYHYHYLLNVKDFYKDFENVKVTIIYPENYPLKSNLEGTTSEMGDKKILTIKLNEDLKNLSFSYMEGRISKIGIFLYRHFPFLYGEAFGYFLFYFILPIGIVIALFILIYFLLIRKRRLQSK